MNDSMTKTQVGKLLTLYKQHLMFEKSLSANTLNAYVHDVERLIVYLNTLEEPVHPLDVHIGQLESFLA